MRIAIVGVGSMGNWFAKTLSWEHELAVYDIDEKKAGSVRNAKVLPSVESLKDFDPDMLLNAVTLSETTKVFDQALPHLSDRCVLCDITSVKGDLPGYYRDVNRKFVSMHPMFGPTFADMGQLREENVIFIRESDQGAARLFREFFDGLGLKSFEYTFKEHEEMMAYSLSTPFATSMVFAACVNNTAVPGTTFARHRMLARKLLSEDDHLLAEVLFNPYTLGQLEKITGRLEYLKHIIKNRDYEEAQKFFGKLRENLS